MLRFLSRWVGNANPVDDIASTSGAARWQRIDVAEVRVDERRRLCVMPSHGDYPDVRRAALEVRWDPAGRFFYSPAPRDWSYPRWFDQIATAVRREYGTRLTLTEHTRWVNVSETARRAMERAAFRPTRQH